MKHYLGSGASAYMYWNMSLQKGGVSRWGWAQNSLVTVDLEAGTFEHNHEYHLLKHVSGLVQLSEDLPLRVRVGEQVIEPTLPADSFNPLVLRP